MSKGIDLYINGVYCGKSGESRRLELIWAIQRINKSAGTDFLVKFSDSELQKYLDRLSP